MNDVGFYGKLACRGDFVSRSLPQTFIQPWDQWLAAGIQASQQALGEQWLQAYLVSPLWRFALAPGVCGTDAVVGVLMPSIDRVGRYFPLTVAQVLEPGASVAGVVGAADDWFEALNGPCWARSRLTRRSRTSRRPCSLFTAQGRCQRVRA